MNAPLSYSEQLSLFEPLDAIDEPVSSMAIQYRRSNRARRLTLKVYDDGAVEVVVPRFVSDLDAQTFVASHEQWIREQTAGRTPRAPATRPTTIALPALDEQWQLDVRRQRRVRDRPQLRPGNSSRHFCLRIPVSDPENDALVRPHVKVALLQRAKTMYSDLLKPLSLEMGSPFRRLQVRDQKTCWGSCSSRGTISMNYAGLFLSPAAVRYLCVHELAHCHHMDHSPAFWALVERYEPQARALDKQLGSKRDVVPRWLW